MQAVEMGLGQREGSVVVDDSLVQTFRAMPKIELHRHLEGSLRLDTLLNIALEHNITLPTFNVNSLRPYVQMMPDEPRTWQQFIGKFAVLRMFYRSERIIRQVAYEVVADAANDGIQYMELRFTPQALNNLLQCDFSDVVGWVCEAAAQSAADHHMQVRLILSMNRHESTDIGEKTLAAAVTHRDHGVVGLDLAGKEAEYSAEPFLSLFRRATDAGLGITIHAGEWSGADGVRSAVEVGAKRIGHGIRAIEDPSVVALLAERGTLLEVCPTSNIHSGAVADYAAHPLARLYRAGVRTTINTDDPLISNITLSDELAAVMTGCGLSLDDIKRQTINAAESAFLPESERIALVERFQRSLYSE